MPYLVNQHVAGHVVLIKPRTWHHVFCVWMPLSHGSWSLIQVAGDLRCHDTYVMSLQLYLTSVYHIGNYVIHHHVVLHGGSCSKNADLNILLLLQRSRRSIKGKHSLVEWWESGDHLLASGVGILCFWHQIPLPEASKWYPSSHHLTWDVFLSITTSP